MQLKIENKILLEAIAAVGGATSPNHAMPILGHISFTINKGVATFIGTDTEVQISYTHNTGEEGINMSGTLPAAKLSTICKSFDTKDIVTIAQKELNFSLSAGRSKFKLAGLEQETFPYIISDEEEGEPETVSLKREDLLSVLNKVNSCKANNDVRFYLNGVLFDLHKEGLNVVATDGHRLAVARMKATMKKRSQTHCSKRRRGGTNQSF